MLTGFWLGLRFGLSKVYGIITGIREPTIRVDSEVGKGTVFAITLPVCSVKV